MARLTGGRGGATPRTELHVPDLHRSPHQPKLVTADSLFRRAVVLLASEHPDLTVGPLFRLARDRVAAAFDVLDDVPDDDEAAP